MTLLMTLLSTQVQQKKMHNVSVRHEKVCILLLEQKFLQAATCATMHVVRLSIMHCIYIYKHTYAQ